TFDFWSTLFDDIGDVGHRRQEWRVATMQQALAKGGWQGELEQVIAAVGEAEGQCTTIRHLGGVDFTPEEQLTAILNMLEFNPSPVVRDEVFEAYTTAVDHFPPDPLPGAISVVKEISRELPIALISNTGITPGSVLRRVLAKAGILECFKVLTFSNEVNMVKPNPGIFLHTAHQLGVDISETLHVGDNFRADVLGAVGVGAKGVWLNPQGGSAPEAYAVIKAMAELRDVVLRG
ncbi:MAG: HAD family hydrolase, partial [Peptococcaceae bacterium]|nr:HAD family hydrolase [Peptococcaceae bacterium]